MASLGGAIIVNQNHPKELILKDTLCRLLNSIHLKEMKNNLQQNRIINPEEKLVQLINNII